MTFARRQLRIRVLEALARTAKQFRTRHDLWPLRVPREPVPLDDVIDHVLGADRPQFDERDLRSRTLLQLEWDADEAGRPARWDAWMIALPNGLHLYCDSDEEETRILASAKRDAEGGELDEFFLELLAESAGEHFGIEMSGGAPSRVRTSITNRELLVEIFVNLFEVTKSEDSVRQALVARDPQSPRDAQPGGSDFRADVEQWLDCVMK